MKSTTVLHRRHPPPPPPRQTPPTRQTSRWERLLQATLSHTRPCTTKRNSRLPLHHHTGQLSNWLIELAPLALILPLPHLQTTNIVRDPTACSAAPTSASVPTTPPRSAPDTNQIRTSPAPHLPRQLPSFSPQFFLPRHISTPPMSLICNPSYSPCLFYIHPVALQ